MHLRVQYENIERSHDAEILKENIHTPATTHCVVGTPATTHCAVGAPAPATTRCAVGAPAPATTRCAVGAPATTRCAVGGDLLVIIISAKNDRVIERFLKRSIRYLITIIGEILLDCHFY